MKENQANVIESQDNTIVPSLEIPSFDYNKLDEIIQGEKEQQKLLNEILEYQKKISDYYVPTDEEKKKQKQEQQKKLEEELKLQKELEEEQEQLDLELQQEKEYQEEYNAQVLQQLTLLNENIAKVEFVNQNTNGYLYILCFGFLFAFVMSFIYKTIRKFL